MSLRLQYTPPGGVIGAVLAKLFGEDPGRQAYDALRNLKQVVETGEVVRSDGVLSGSRVKQRTGQPLDTDEHG